MVEDRLSSLGVLAVEQEIARGIKIDDLTDEFVESKMLKALI